MVSIAEFESTVTLVFMLAVVVVGVLMILLIFYLEHRKEMKLIDEGVYEVDEPDRGLWILAGGLIVLAVGIGTMVESVISGSEFDGIVPALVGMAALVYYYLTRIRAVG